MTLVGNTRPWMPIRGGFHNGPHYKTTIYANKKKKDHSTISPTPGGVITHKRKSGKMSTSIQPKVKRAKNNIKRTPKARKTPVLKKTPKKKVVKKKNPYYNQKPNLNAYRKQLGRKLTHMLNAHQDYLHNGKITQRVQGLW
jgi:hypothetical protein